MRALVFHLDRDNARSDSCLGGFLGTNSPACRGPHHQGRHCSAGAEPSPRQEPKRLTLSFAGAWDAGSPVRLLIRAGRSAMMRRTRTPQMAKTREVLFLEGGLVLASSFISEFLSAPGARNT